MPTDWRNGTINGTNAIWIRCRISAVSAPTEGGAQSTQKIQAGDYCIIVTGYSSGTPGTMTDVQSANDAGSWGVVTTQANGQYFVDCHFAIGHFLTTSGAGSEGYFAMVNEAVEFRGGVKMGGESGLAHEWTIGKLISLANFTTEGGCTITFNNVYSRQWYTFLRARGTIYIYDSKIEHVAGSGGYFYRSDRLINVMVDNMQMGYPTDDIMNRCNLRKKWSAATDSAQGTINDIFAHDSTYVIRRPGNHSNTITAVNMKVRNCSYMLTVSIGTTGTGILEVVDADTNTWAIYWASSAVPNSQSMKEQYTFNLVVLDTKNNGINGATVKLVDKNGTQQFSISSAADGSITEQIVTAKLYEYGSGSNPGVTTITDYNNFTLTIKVAGYKEYKKKFTLNEKIDWRVALKRRRFIETRSRVGS